MRPRGLILPLLGVVAVVAARRWLDVVEVRGRSMSPTLLPGDRLLAMRARPRAGDVVLAPDPWVPSRELIKRVATTDARGIHLRGDNPASSTDARTFGGLSPDAVRWRVLLRYWPLQRMGAIPAATVDQDGGDPACAFPDALVAG